MCQIINFHINISYGSMFVKHYALQTQDIMQSEELCSFFFYRQHINELIGIYEQTNR